jgi:MFS family permease
MISTWLAPRLARFDIHYGWAVVAVTFLAALVSAGVAGAPGVFIGPLQKEFGWSTAEISSALSIRFFLFGLTAPFAAALMNRYGLRNVSFIALICVGVSLLLSLGMTQIWHMVALWGVLGGIGTGMTALVLAATVSARCASRPCRRHLDREFRHGTVDLSAYDRSHYRAFGLAGGTRRTLRDSPLRRPACCW